MSKSIGFLASAIRILEEEGKPLHYREITQRALDKGWVVTKGTTPEATMNALIATQIKKQGEASEILRTAPGVFGLRRWQDGDQRYLFEMELSTGRSFVPGYPTYEDVRAVLPVWEGVPRSAVTRMRAAIMSLTGTPEEQVAWNDPDTWIRERLDGDNREIARRTWEESGSRVNPRHTVGHWLLVTNHRLLEEDHGGALRLTDIGDSFLKESAGTVVRRIDEAEGLLEILRLIADLEAPRMSDLLDPWMDYLRDESNVRAETTAKSYLRSRIHNLEARGLVERDGYTLTLSKSGRSYSAETVEDQPRREPDPEKVLQKHLTDQRKHVRESMRDLLEDIDPTAFEYLVKQLLEAMGYEDVDVTPKSNDKGVDVVGTITVGITTIREVVQVKRHRGNIQRVVLDGLRGSLHRFEAMRGTIITVGGFSKGTQKAAFEAGAAPITLIDGDRLIDLLIEHGIGVRKRNVEVWDIAPDDFAQIETEQG